MNCIDCNGRTLVYDTRESGEMGLRRKRKCMVCSLRFATIEVLEGRVRKHEPAKPKPPKPERVRPAKSSIQRRQPDDQPSIDPDEFDYQQEVMDIARELGAYGTNYD